MTIRMSSLQYMYNYKTALNRAYKKQADLMEHADGTHIHRGSDNPEEYAKLLRFNVSQFENDQYQKDVKNAISFMQTEDATLTNMVSIAKTFAEKTIQAAVTTNTSSDYEAIAKEMYSCIEETLSLCNRQQGDRYVFSGQRDTTQPFVLSEDYYDRGMLKTLDTAQTKFFKNHISEGDSFVYQMLQLKDDDGNEYYFDTEYGDVFNRKFVDETYKELLTLDFANINAAKAYVANMEVDSASTDSTVADAAQAEMANETSKYSVTKQLLEEGIYGTVNVDKEDTSTTVFSVSTYFDSKGVIKDDSATLDVTIPTTDANGNATTTTTALSFVTISQQIVTYNGDFKHISMVKENGATDMISDVVNVTGEDAFGFDLFDNDASGNERSGTAYLNSMLTVHGQILKEDVPWLNSDGVTISNATHNNMLLAQSTIGARLQLYTNVSTMLESQGDVITEDITNTTGTDVAELATRLMEMTSLYNMALSIGGRILPVSLADYL
ncbi:MAG: hypothetical protein IJU91_02265 [Selenomonadaceae bacterium]|nr:hypothetical protein [Selenomonadaceae bacterium]